MKRTRVALIAAVVATAASAKTGYINLELTCKPASTSLAYLCTVKATDPIGKPIEHAVITLSADMPAMAMAHNVSPVEAQAIEGRPGEYRGPIMLEMPGEWAVKVHMKAPQTKVVVQKLQFEKDSVSPVARR